MVGSINFARLISSNPCGVRREIINSPRSLNSHVFSPLRTRWIVAQRSSGTAELSSQTWWPLSTAARAKAQALSLGWVAPLGEESEALAHAASGRLLIKLKREEKLLPSTVVREQLEEKVAVIGAGIVGTACACYLLREGHDVCLIDRGEPGAMTSFGNSGAISPASVAPIAMPGMATQIPKWLLDPTGPPRGWVWATGRRTRSIRLGRQLLALGLAQIVREGVAQL